MKIKSGGQNQGTTLYKNYLYLLKTGENRSVFGIFPVFREQFEVSESGGEHN
jgi:hypothetical protein